MNAVNQIVLAIRNEIDAHKASTNVFTGAKGGELNQGGFSMSIYFDEELNEYSAELCFSADTGYTVLYENNEPEVKTLWENKDEAEEILVKFAELFLHEDWILEI